MESKDVYKIVLIPDGNGYTVNIPKLGIYTEGKNIIECIEMSRDAICLTLLSYEDNNIAPPDYNDNVVLNKDEIESYVDVDIRAYKLKHDTKKVKKNCTISKYLNDEGTRRGINFSQLLETALINALG